MLYSILTVVAAFLITWMVIQNTTPRAALSDHSGTCSWTPNCVSSKDQRETFHVDPLPLLESNNPIEELEKLVKSMKGAVILKRSENYLHVEFTSKLLKFKDDVEFLVDDHEGVIHIRSSSRVGYGDMGVNRKRVERIRAEWKKRSLSDVPLH